MKALILVLTLVVTFQCQISAAIASYPYPVLYVRSDSSNTDPSCGTSIASPCKSIATAVTHAYDCGATTIKVAQGNYLEQISIYNINLPADELGQLTIEGGWNTDFTAQSPDPTKTRVTPSGNNAVIDIAIPGLWFRVGLRLSYLTLKGMQDSQRVGLQAIAASASTIDLDLEHCHIESFRGHGISLAANNVADITMMVDDTTIQGNYQYPSNQSWTGAGIYAGSYSDSTVTIILTKNTISNNQALSGGGIFLSSNAATVNATLINNILAENQADTAGGAISAFAGQDGTMQLIMTNNTISNNQAGSPAGGISFDSFNTAQITADLTNNIVWGNNNSDIFINQYDTSTTAVNSYYSMIGVVQNDGVTSSYHGYNNIHINPALNANYHLTGTSPAKNRGIC